MPSSETTSLIGKVEGMMLRMILFSVSILIIVACAALIIKLIRLAFS